MEIEYTKQSEKQIKLMDSKTKQRIKEGSIGLTEKPSKGDIKSLKEYSGERLRLRIGGIRIIFQYRLVKEKEVLYIIDIGNRGDIYK